MSRLLAGSCVLALVLLAFVPANAQNFQGFYAGAYGGGVFGNSDAHTFPVFSPFGYFATTSPPAIALVGTQKISPNGFSGGGTFGFNLQHRALVYGFEADFGAMNLDDSKSGSATYPCCAPTAFTVTQTVKTDWLITARPRVGVAVGKVLFFGTAGLASTRLHYSELFTDTFATAHESAAVDQIRKGWSAGGGAELLLNKHWSAKAEFLHADFGQVSTTSINLTAFTPPIKFPSNVFTHNGDLTANMARGGINFHF